MNSVETDNDRNQVTVATTATVFNNQIIVDVEENNNQNENLQPNIGEFDPALSKIGILLPGELGLIGERLQWIITVNNTGAVAGTNVVFTDTLRDELRVTGFTSSRGTGTITGQTVTINIGTVKPGDIINITIDSIVLESNITVDNTACVNSDSGTTDCVTSPSVQTIRITELPAMGEQPWWRNWLLSIVGFVALGLVGSVWLIDNRQSI